MTLTKTNMREKAIRVCNNCNKTGYQRLSIATATNREMLGGTCRNFSNIQNNLPDSRNVERFKQQEQQQLSQENTLCDYSKN